MINWFPQIRSGSKVSTREEGINAIALSHVADIASSYSGAMMLSVNSTKNTKLSYFITSCLQVRTEIMWICDLTTFWVKLLTFLVLFLLGWFFRHVCNFSLTLGPWLLSRPFSVAHNSSIVCDKIRVSHPYSTCI